MYETHSIAYTDYNVAAALILPRGSSYIATVESGSENTLSVRSCGAQPHSIKTCREA